MVLEALVVLLLIFINGFFALSEMAVVTSRKARLRQLAQDSRRADRALALSEHPEKFLSSVQVGITLVNVLAGLFGGAAFGPRFAAALTGAGMDPDIAGPLGTTLAVVLITYVTIVVGELLPKRAALIAPEPIAVVVALPMQIIARVAAPFVALLSFSTRMLLRLLRLEKSTAEQVTEEEIQMLVAEGHEQGVIDADERNMLNRVLRLGDRTADSLMTPRTRIVWLDAGAPAQDNLAVMRDTPYSRYPVYRGTDKEVVGVLEVKSLAGYIGGGTTPDLFGALKPPLFVSESTKAMSLLEIFRDEQQTLALVVDEYGDIVGLVTVNQLLGAVVGRLQHAREHTEDAMVTSRDDGSYLVDGGLSTEDLRELLELARLPDEEDHDYNTVAGMMIAHFGRIPHAGEHFAFSGWRFEVVDLDGARIDKLLLSPVAPAEDAEAV